MIQAHRAGDKDDVERRQVHGFGVGGGEVCDVREGVRGMVGATTGGSWRTAL